jgi:hypothetical protein
MLSSTAGQDVRPPMHLPLEPQQNPASDMPAKLCSIFANLLPCRMRGLRVGNFEYVSEALELGRLAGNRFQLLMRACQPLHPPEGDTSASGAHMDEDSATKLEAQAGA